MCCDDFVVQLFQLCRLLENVKVLANPAHPKFAGMAPESFISEIAENVAGELRDVPFFGKQPGLTFKHGLGNAAVTIAHDGNSHSLSLGENIPKRLTHPIGERQARTAEN